jgi:hypothetical protein
MIDAGAQTWAGLDRSYHFLRLRDLGHFRSRREALDRRPQHGVGLRVTAGGAIELRQRQRRAQFEAARALQAVLQSAYLIPIAMECGPTRCSTRVAEKPASRIQA